MKILVPFYNPGSKLLDRCLKSIENQTYKNFQVCLIDDASTDSTLKKIQRYQEKYKNIRIYENKKNIGLTKCLNILLEKTQGEYIARQDADDYSSSNRLEFQINFLHVNKLDACTSRSIIQNSNKLIPGLSYYLPINLFVQ